MSGSNSLLSQSQKEVKYKSDKVLTIVKELKNVETMLTKLKDDSFRDALAR